MKQKRLKKNFSAKFQRFRAIQGSDSDESDDDVDDEMFEDNDFDWNVKKFFDALKDRLTFNECSKLLILKLFRTQIQSSIQCNLSAYQLWFFPNIKLNKNDLSLLIAHLQLLDSGHLKPKICRHQCNPNLTSVVCRSPEELFHFYVGHSSYNPSVVIGLS